MTRTGSCPVTRSFMNAAAQQELTTRPSLLVTSHRLASAPGRLDSESESVDCESRSGPVHHNVKVPPAAGRRSFQVVDLEPEAARPTASGRLARRRPGPGALQMHVPQRPFQPALT